MTAVGLPPARTIEFTVNRARMTTPEVTQAARRVVTSCATRRPRPKPQSVRPAIGRRSSCWSITGRLAHASATSATMWSSAGPPTSTGTTSLAWKRVMAAANRAGATHLWRLPLPGWRTTSG